MEPTPTSKLRGCLSLCNTLLSLAGALLPLARSMNTSTNASAGGAHVPLGHGRACLIEGARGHVDDSGAAIPRLLPKCLFYLHVPKTGSMAQLAFTQYVCGFPMLIDAVEHEGNFKAILARPAGTSRQSCMAKFARFRGGHQPLPSITPIEKVAIDTAGHNRTAARILDRHRVVEVERLLGGHGAPGTLVRGGLPTRLSPNGSYPFPLWYGQVVTMIREPLDRIVSGLFHNFHDCSNNCGGKWHGERSHGENSKTVSPRLVDWPITDVLSNTFVAWQYAYYVRHTYTKLFSGVGLHNKDRGKNGTLAVALTRLRHGVAFFGITERWAESMCLFCKMANLSHNENSNFLLKGRASLNPQISRDNARALLVETGWQQRGMDSVDDTLYRHATELFNTRLKAHGCYNYTPGPSSTTGSATHSASGATAVFAGFDANGDAVVTNGELVAVVSAFLANYGAKLQRYAHTDINTRKTKLRWRSSEEWAALVLAALDTDRDLVLSITEFDAAALWHVFRFPDGFH